LVAAAFLVEATKTSFVVPNFVAVTKPFSSVHLFYASIIEVTSNAVSDYPRGKKTVIESKRAYFAALLVCSFSLGKDKITSLVLLEKNAYHFFKEIVRTRKFKVKLLY